MNPHKQAPAHRLRHIASALMLWLVALLSVSAGVQPAVSLDLAPTGQAADAARSVDLPIQRSTAASLQSRVALVSERAFEALPATGFDGPDAAILPHQQNRLSAPGADLCAPVPAPFALGGRIVGFRARAPPILA